MNLVHWESSLWVTNTKYPRIHMDWVDVSWYLYALQNRFLTWLSLTNLCRQEVVLLDNEIGFNEAIIEEREQGIRDIEEQIGEASEIFKDLAVLVHEQGVVIGKIQIPSWWLFIQFHFATLHSWSFCFFCFYLIYLAYWPIITDDIHSNIDNSSAATTQARVQLSKASKGVKTRSSWVSRKLSCPIKLSWAQLEAGFWIMIITSLIYFDHQCLAVCASICTVR